MMPATLTVHGVLMEICGLGVLIRGPSGIGKGELALELISRGHRLIADDAPQISLSTSNKMLKKAIHGLFQLAKQKAWFLLCSIFQTHKPCLKNGGASMHRTQAVFEQPANSLSGTCPPLLRNLLEVRSLGVLNIAVLFGEQAVASSTPLQLIVTLETIAESEITERDIAGLRHTPCRLLDVDIPEIRLALRAGRPTALLVETLVKNFKLQQQGYSVHADLSKRQRRAMDSS